MRKITFGNEKADTILIQPVSGDELKFAEDELKLIKESTGADFCMYAVEVDNWNSDLSPWETEPVFGKEGFGDGAEKTLEEILKFCEDKSRRYIIGGYSLAGLFSIWSAYQTDIFCSVAAASPSIWFPGFVDYMKEHEIKTDKVYLSLGDKEEKTRNPVMATVREKIEEAYSLLKEKGIKSNLEMNKGNHFRDVDIRTAKAFSWVL